MFDDTAAVLEVVAGAVDLHGALARDVAALGDHAEADDLRPERRSRGRAHAALPEQVGGERNWDYRYTWVRDASFSVYALLGMGFREEAAAFGSWLRDRVRRAGGGEAGPLNIMYRVDGSRDLKEEVLEHWEGYRGSNPVRIGNGAAGQLQLDIYGEAIDSLYFGDQHGLPVRPRRVGRRSATCSTGCATTGTSPRRASGRPAAAGRTSPTAG